MEQAKYDVFISYSRKDYVDENQNVIPGNVVSKIKEALTNAGISYWFDEEGIYSGQNFVEKIVTNIECSRLFLFLSTANANKSKYTCKEIASADEFGKHIIPVRIDNTPYNKKVMFRIADLDYIEYYSNPQKGLQELIDSIKVHLDEILTEEKKIQEEREKKKEAERKRVEEENIRKKIEEEHRRQEMRKLISEIELSVEELDNKEKNIDLSRRKLLQLVQNIDDENEKNRLIGLIDNCGITRLKQNEESKAWVTEKEELLKKIADLEQKCKQQKQIIDNQDNGKEVYLAGNNTGVSYKSIQKLKSTWQLFKDTCNKRNVFTNITLIGSIFVGLCCLFFSIIISFDKQGYTNLIISEFFLLFFFFYGMVYVLLNKRTGVWIVLASPIFVSLLMYNLGIMYLYQFVLLAIGLSCIPLLTLFLKKDNNSAWSLMRTDHSLFKNKNYLIPVFFYVLFLFLSLIFQKTTEETNESERPASESSYNENKEVEKAEETWDADTYKAEEAEPEVEPDDEEIAEDNQ